MKRKILLSLLTLTLALCTFGLTACNLINGGDNNGDSTPPHEHSYTPNITPPTCTEKGYTIYTCDCGDIYINANDETKALGHDIANQNAKQASCTEVGFNAYEYCTRCDYTTRVDIPSTGHTYVGEICTNCQGLKPTDGLEYTFTDYPARYFITGLGTATTNKIVIAEEYNGLPVTGIGSRAFENCNGLESITIPDSIDSIGGLAFAGCSNLESITIANDNTKYHSDGNCIIETASKTLIVACKSSVIPTDGSATSIGENAFRGCASLESITIPDSITSIGDYAFNGCSSLTSVTIPDSVTIIGDYAFNECESLEKINYLGSIDSWTMIDFCNSYSNPTYYANNLYINDVLITEINLATATYIGNYAFQYCYNLTSVTIPDSVTSIGNYAFSACSKLTSITIGDNVTSIGNYAFYYCASLESGTIGNSVTSIGDNAFLYCTSLISVTIPDNVTSIGNYAFKYCYNLQYNIYDNAKYLGNKSNPYVCLIEASNRAITSCEINSNTKVICHQAFFSCTILESVTIPDSVTSISDDAFEYCYNLTSVTIPDSVTSIGNGAFLYCYKLVEVINKSELNIETGSKENGYVGYYAKQVLTEKPTISNFIEENDYIFYIYNGFYYILGYKGKETEITLPNNVNGYDYAIYNYAFSGCASLESITIPDNVTSIGQSAFEGCHNLQYNVYDNAKYLGNKSNPYLCLIEASNRSITSCEINSNTKFISENAFLYCASLESIIIPDSVTSIGENAFHGCASLESVTIGNSVTSIGQSAFYECSSLTSITIGDSVTSIGENAFRGCASLESVTIPDSVTSIGENAFHGCASLESATIGNSVTSISDGAFFGCASLESVTIPDSVTSIGQSAFYYCASLESATIGNSVTSIGQSAFYKCSSLTSITIGDSVISIGNGAFQYCRLLENINYNGTKAQWKTINKISDWNNITGNYTIHCTDGDIAK